MNLDLKALIPPKRGDDKGDQALPPPPPKRWGWEHIKIDASGETLAASVAEPYARGCANCHARHDGFKGYVLIENNTVAECPACRVLRLRVRDLSRSRLPSKFYGKTYNWENVIIDGQRDPSSAFFGWLEGVASSLASGDSSDLSSIALLGGTGRGKSHAAFILAQRAIDLGIGVTWVNWGRILNRIMDKEVNEGAAFSEIYGFGFIVVDDLGVKSYNSWARDLTCSFLERLPSDCVAVFTSNGTPDGDGAAGLDQMIGARAASRLHGVCGRGAAVFCFGGSDYRKG